MKKLVEILLVVCISLITVTVSAQVTARMEVSARVVAGSTVSASSSQVNLFASDSSAADVDMDFPVLSLLTSGSTGVMVSMKDVSDLANDEGSSLSMDGLQLVALPDLNGRVTYNLKGKSASSRKLAGIYTGNLTAVIEYF